MTIAAGRIHRRGNARALLVCLGALWLTVFAPWHVGAEATTADQPPLHEQIAVQLIDIGKVDSSAGTYSMDFYLQLRCDRPCSVNDLTVVNGTMSPPEILADEPQRKLYRVQAALNTTFSFTRYPFDVHYLYLALEPKNPDADGVKQLVLEADNAETGVSSLVDASGWQLRPHPLYRTRVSEEQHVLFTVPHDHYEFGVVIEHAGWGAFLKTLFPTLVIMLTNFLSFLLRADKNATARLGIHTAALTAMILWHINITSNLPPLGYLTYADRFMLVNYLAISLSLIATVIAILFTDWMQNRDIRRIEAVARVLTPTLWVLLQAVVLIGLFRDTAGGLL